MSAGRLHRRALLGGLEHFPITDSHLSENALASLSKVFLTHHHSDHNADYGNLLLLSWAADLEPFPT